MSESVLCLDCGNTRLKWGLRAGGDWLAQGVLSLAETPTIAASLPQRPTRVVACNVAGPAAVAAMSRLAEQLGAPISWVKGQAAQGGVSNRYSLPAKLGADRWAALIGAWHLHHGPCLVVNAGTATTVDVLDGEGVFQGGLILPGLAMMRAALATNTAGLPHAAGSYRDLPRDTDDAIVSGAIQATLGAIERMFLQLAGAANALCLLSGGAAAELAAPTTLPLRRIDNLVLEGLARIAAES